MKYQKNNDILNELLHKKYDDGVSFCKVFIDEKDLYKTFVLNKKYDCHYLSQQTNFISTFFCPHERDDIPEYIN
jgi:hypothetical protein